MLLLSSEVLRNSADGLFVYLRVEDIRSVIDTFRVAIVETLVKVCSDAAEVAGRHLLTGFLRPAYSICTTLRGDSVDGDVIEKRKMKFF